jgi:hypothetical protein
VTSRDRIILLVLAVGGILAGFWFGLLAPKREEAKTLSAQLASEQQRLDRAEASSADAQRARDSYVADYAAFARLGKAVPTEDAVPSLVYQLESVSRGARIDFQSITSGGGDASSATSTPSSTSSTTPSTPTPATGAAAGGATAGVAPMPFSFTFTGSFFDMEHLLDRVHRFVTARNGKVKVHGRLLSINDIALTAAPTGFPKVQATISASAYQAPAAQAAAPGGATPAPGATTPAPGTASSTTPPTTTATATGATP